MFQHQEETDYLGVCIADDLDHLFILAAGDSDHPGISAHQSVLAEGSFPGVRATEDPSHLGAFNAGDQDPMEFRVAEDQKNWLFRFEIIQIECMI